MIKILGFTKNEYGVGRNATDKTGNFRGEDKFFLNSIKIDGSFDLETNDQLIIVLHRKHLVFINYFKNMEDNFTGKQTKIGFRQNYFFIER